jgi:RNA polymerase sigma factor (sigma-70 family)
MKVGFGINTVSNRKPVAFTAKKEDFWNQKKGSDEKMRDYFREYRQTSNPTLANQIVVLNQRLVTRIARAVKGSIFPDSIQDGNIGLAKAMENYDPDHISLASFSTFARTFIVNEVNNGVRDLRPILAKTEHYDQIEERINQEPELSEQSQLERLGIGVKSLQNFQKGSTYTRTSEVDTIDNRPAVENLSSHYYEASNHSPEPPLTPEEALIFKEAHTKVSEAIASSNPKTAALLSDLYRSDEPVRLIAEKHNVGVCYSNRLAREFAERMNKDLFKIKIRKKK